MLTALCSAMGIAFACSNQLPNGLRTPAADTASQIETRAVTGCRSFDIVLNSSTSGVAATPSGDAGCGPAVPELVGQATFDLATRVLSVRIALQDLGDISLSAP